MSNKDYLNDQYESYNDRNRDENRDENREREMSKYRDKYVYSSFLEDFSKDARDLEDAYLNNSKDVDVRQLVNCVKNANQLIDYLKNTSINNIFNVSMGDEQLYQFKLISLKYKEHIMQQLNDIINVILLKNKSYKIDHLCYDDQIERLLKITSKICNTNEDVYINMLFKKLLITLLNERDIVDNIEDYTPISYDEYWRGAIDCKFMKDLDQHIIVNKTLTN